MKTVELLSTQNVLIDHQTATFGERFGAWSLDALLLSVTYFVLNAIFLGLGFFDGGGVGTLASAFAQLFPWVGVMLYHFLCETMWGGQTIGKRALKIRVVKLDGTEASFTDHFVRAIFLMIDVYCLIGALVSLVSPRSQRIGDVVANTAVVRMRGRDQFRLSDIESIKTRENYVPQFPQVTQLNEQDIIVVKHCINRYDQQRTQAHYDAIVHLSNKLTQLLEIKHCIQYNHRDFLYTLLSDYIVLTRS